MRTSCSVQKDMGLLMGLLLSKALQPFFNQSFVLNSLSQAIIAKIGFLLSIIKYGYPIISKEVSRDVFSARRTPNGKTAQKFVAGSPFYKKYGGNFNLSVNTIIFYNHLTVCVCNGKVVCMYVCM